MKILHVDMGKEWRGGQRQCMLLHTNLINNGIDSHLLCRKGYEFEKHNIQSSYSALFRGEVSPTSYRNLKKIINDINPDIVHSHDAASLTPLLLIKLFGGKFELINTRRVDFSVNKNFISLKKYNNNRVNIVAVSHGIKRVLIGDGIPPEKIHVIHDGVPPLLMPLAKEVSQVKIELGIPSDAFVLGNVANFAPHKDYFTLLNAYKIFTKHVPNSKLLLVGTGPLFNDIKNECTQLGLTDNVIFTGFRNDISQLVSCMDIFTVSSYLEGLNTSIIDAMFLGRPTVATDTGGIPELVQNGETGYLAPIRNPQALADKMIQLANEPENCAVFGKNAMVKALNFTDTVMTNKYIDYYQELTK